MTRIRALMACLAVVVAGCSTASIAADTRPSGSTNAIVDPAGLRPSDLPASPYGILVLGDSIAAGATAGDLDLTWSRTLERALRARYPSANVFVSNFAQSGSAIDYTEQVVASLPLDEYRLAIIFEGRNDHGPVAEWATLYRNVVDRLEAAGVRVIVGIAPPARGPDGWSAGDDFAAKVPILRAMGRTVLDLDAAFRALGASAAAALYTDSLHENAQGQAFIADLALAAVGPLP